MLGERRGRAGPGRRDALPGACALLRAQGSRIGRGCGGQTTAMTSEQDRSIDETQQQTADEADRMEDRLDRLDDHIGEAAKKGHVERRESASEDAEDAGLSEVVEGDDIAPGDDDDAPSDAAR